MQNIECDHAICSPKIHALCFLTKFYGNSTLWWLCEFWWKIVEFTLIVYRTKNMVPKKYQCLLNGCKIYFLQCFSCVLSENIFSVLEKEKKVQFYMQTFTSAYFLFLQQTSDVLTNHCIVTIFDNWWKRREYVLINVCAQNWTFSKILKMFFLRTQEKH